MRFKLHWFFVFLSAVIVPWLTSQHPVKAQRGEWYPFSNFPMYANFEKTAYYVYVTDLQDQPVAIAPTFCTWPTAVKKAYDAKLKELAKTAGKASKKLSAEECRPAGDAVLRQICASSRYPDEVKKHAGYRLHAVEIWLDNGQIRQQTKLVGEIR